MFQYAWVPKQTIGLPGLQHPAAACSRSAHVTESPQELFPSCIADPYLTQGLYLSSVECAAHPLKRSSGGCSSQVHLLANAAPIPGTLRSPAGAGAAAASAAWCDGICLGLCGCLLLPTHSATAVQCCPCNWPIGLRTLPFAALPA
jgi:hypothetical protein